MFLGEDAGAENFGGVVVEDGDGALEDDGAVVDLLVDEVDGAAGDFGPGGERLGLGVEARKGGQKRWVDVEDAVAEGGDERRGDDAHIAGEADEADLLLMKAGEDFGVVLGASAADGRDAKGRQAKRAGRGEAVRVGEVGDDAGDLGRGEAMQADGLGDGEEVGAAAGKEDA